MVMEMTTLYHGTDHQFDGLPSSESGWTWWTEDAARAEAYGHRLIERGDGLVVLNTSADDDRDFIDELANAGVDVEGIDSLYDEEMDLAYEPHQLIGRYGVDLAQRIRAAGYDAIRHWEDHYAAGEGFVLAIAS